jgi:8-oxo-dGTP pyrophosphatase MutT (NUDIX family)
MKRNRSGRSAPILAAGGIVKGEGLNEGKIAVVWRRRYKGEIGLPKGKVKGSEDLLVAARREVMEETGWDVEILEYAGTTHYRVGRRPKAVCYLIMKVSQSSPTSPIDTEEIEKVEWVTPSQANGALTHREDRELVAAVYGLPRD